MNKKTINNELVILVHGFFRSKKDMLPLAMNLEEFGYQIYTPNLSTTFGLL